MCTDKQDRRQAKHIRRQVSIQKCVFVSFSPILFVVPHAIARLFAFTPLLFSSPSSFSPRPSFPHQFPVGVASLPLSRPTAPMPAHPRPPTRARPRAHVLHVSPSCTRTCAHTRVRMCTCSCVCSDLRGKESEPAISWQPLLRPWMAFPTTCCI